MKLEKGTMREKGDLKVGDGDKKRIKIYET